MFSAPAQNVALDYDGSATFSWHGVPTGAPLIMTITLHGAQQGVRFELPIPGDSLLPVPFSKLPPDAGQYDWKIWLQHPTYGAICEHSGAFIRKLPPFM